MIGLRFFPLKSADVRGAGTRDEPLRTSAWKAKADRVLCQLVMFITVFFHWMYKMNYSCHKSLLLFMAGLFIGFLVEKCVACQSRKYGFGWHRLKVSSDSGLT